MSAITKARMRLPGHLQQTRNRMGVVNCDLYGRRLH
jgi:hypothetical protein